MKTEKCVRNGLPILILLLLVTFSILSIRGQGQLQWTTNIDIAVFEDGSASWFVQRKTSLLTDFDEALFYEYLNVTSVDELSSNVHAMVDHASLVTGRPMKVESFEVKATVSNTTFGKEGVLQYQFVWTGFAEKTGNNEIMIGDALTGELDLSPNDALKTVYPVGYVPNLIYPSPDKIEDSERTLTWLGPRNFGAGEPVVMFEKGSSSWIDAVRDNALVIFMAGVAVVAGFFGYFLGRRPTYKTESLKLGVGKQEQISLRGIEDDEEKVVRLLLAAGGKLYQSAIAEQCGFSKSKASALLSVMEKKGVITRKKSGRGKIVTLVRDTS